LGRTRVGTCRGLRGLGRTRVTRVTRVGAYAGWDVPRVAAGAAGWAADRRLDSLLRRSWGVLALGLPAACLRRSQGVLGAAGWDAPRVAAGWVDARTPRSDERGVLGVGVGRVRSRKTVTPLQFRDSCHGGIGSSTRFAKTVFQGHFGIECLISGFDSIAQIIRQGYVMLMGTVGKMVPYLIRCQCAWNLGPAARVVLAGHEEVGNLVGGGHATIIAHIIFRRQLHTALPRWVGTCRGLPRVGTRAPAAAGWCLDSLLSASKAFWH
jgi:hypothetical protein